MHIELATKYRDGLTSIIKSLNLESHLLNSFNASGETITLSSSKEDLEKILNASEEDFISTSEDSPDTYAQATLEGLKSVLRDHLADRI